MKESIFTFESVTYRYPDGTLALKNVDLNIGKGEKLAIVGPNGAGKSTLLLHLNGLLKPLSGNVRFRGKSIDYSRRGLQELRKSVGLVFQEPDRQLFSATVFQEVSFGPMNLKLPVEEVEERVRKALETAGAGHLYDRPTHFLSYGEKKLITLAGVLAMSPEVLVLDEPTISLDPYHTTLVAGIIDNVMKQGVTVVLTTHDMNLAYGWADRVLLIKEGMAIKEGCPEDVFSDSLTLAEAGLARPLVLDVYRALKQKGLLPEGLRAPRTLTSLLDAI
jgi:cobalt/nickel transport system ATP-binding protein